MKHAIIVGGTKGLGRELARRFGGAPDWHVSVLGRSRPEQPASNVTYHAVDVADRAAREAALTAAVAAHGPIDTLVFCQRFRGTDDAWAGEMGVTLTATQGTLEWAAARFAPDGWRSVRLGVLALDVDRCITFHGASCGVCARSCPIGERALAMDKGGHPVLKPEGCVGCGVCVTACVTAPSSLSLSLVEEA